MSRPMFELRSFPHWPRFRHADVSGFRVFPTPLLQGQVQGRLFLCELLS